MGLAISVGTLAYCLDDKNPDLEYAEWQRAEFARINRALVAAGLPGHHEPETLPARDYLEQLSSFSYGDIHYLRRAVAYARQAPERFVPLPEEADPTKDLLVENELTIYMDSHFICHSDCEGYYIPVDFAEIIYDDEIAGTMLGSTQRALAEIITAASLIGITLTDGRLSDEEASKIAEDTDFSAPLWIERQVWLTVYQAFRYSIEQGCAVVFT